jgi:hypothetical protein
MPGRSLLRSTFLALLVVPAGACTGAADDTGDAAPDPWTIVASDQPGAFLNIWGSAADDVWAVGADAGSGPVLVHYDGAAWASIPLATSGDLWWMTSVGPDSFWLCGAGGRVLRYAPDTGVTDETVLDPTLTFFGVWAAAADDVWAVGGNVDSARDTAQIWHFDGAAWTRAELPAPAAAGIAIYKVWGRSATDVYAVGTGGIGLHWDGTAWSSVSTGTEANLFTVHGTDVTVWAVGGDFMGEIVSGTGTSWSGEGPDLAPQLNGVYAGGPVPVAVGGQGAVYERGDAGWTADPRGPVTAQDLHSVWVDPAGGMWTAGGHLASFPLDHGVLAYGGDDAVPAL